MAAAAPALALEQVTVTFVSPDAGRYTAVRDATLRVEPGELVASGLKHNELWSYEIVGETLRPIRYGASTDVQLWNVTDLAVQFVLKRLGVY